MAKIAIGAGHGGGGVTPGKRSPAGEYEWDFNNAVVDGFMEEADLYENLEVLRVDDDDVSDGYEDVPLKDRVTMANKWGADIYISVHHNALKSKWGNHTGTETFYYKGSQKSYDLAKVVHQAMLEVYGLRDRGLKEGNWLYVLKNTKMPAVLTEGGFMDSNIDIKVLRDKNRLHEAGRNVMRHVAKYLGLKKKSGKTSSSKPSKTNTGEKTLYRVRKTWNDVRSQRGAFYDLNNAKQIADQHEGYKVFDEKGNVVYVGKKQPKKTTSNTSKSNTNSIVDYLASIGKPTSMDYRKQLAKEYGITNYTGTAEQNLKLLNLLKSGKKPSQSSKPSNTGDKPGRYGWLEIVNVKNAAIVQDRPDRLKSKQLGTLKKGERVPLNGSVRGKNSTSGYWEIVYKGKLGYITGEFGKRV